MDLLSAALDQLPDEIFIKDGRALCPCTGNAPFPSGCHGGNQRQARWRPFRRRAVQSIHKGRRRDLCHGQTDLPRALTVETSAGRFALESDVEISGVRRSGDVIAVCGQVRQSTEAMQSRVLLEAQIDVLEMLAADRPVGGGLCEASYLALLKACSRVLGLVADPSADGSMVAEFIAPSMAADYGQSLIGMMVADNAGTCGTACFGVCRSTRRIFSPTRTGKPSARPRRLMSCAHAGRCLFQRRRDRAWNVRAYSRQPRLPSEFEARCLALGARLAELALERERVTAQLSIMAERDSLTGLPKPFGIFRNAGGGTRLGFCGRPGCRGRGSRCR